METQAQQIAARFKDDGQCWKDSNGVRIEDACEEAGARRDRRNADTRWTFPDGSVITMVGGGWDFGYPDCFCWQGAGHHEVRDGELVPVSAHED